MIRPLRRLAAPLGASLAFCAAPALAQDQLAEATAFYDSAMGERCAPARDFIPPEDLVPQVYDFALAQGEEAQNARIYQFLCDRGAYNQIHVFVFAAPDGRLSLLRFPTPIVEVRYENDDYEGKILGIDITGLSLRTELVNASVEAETGAISEYSLWRGLGDASSSGVWSYDHENATPGAYNLTSYEVDGSYDGETNPHTVIPTSQP